MLRSLVGSEMCIRDRCCGSTGPVSWKNTTWAESASVLVPKSCCKPDTDSDCNNGTDYASLVGVYKEVLYTFVLQKK